MRYQNMAHQHDEVIESLKEANKCYLSQVGENEKLKKQLGQMQLQHQQMMDKFAEFEQKLAQTQSLQQIVQQPKNDIKVANEEQL